MIRINSSSFVFVCLRGSVIYLLIIAGIVVLKCELCLQVLKRMICRVLKGLFLFLANSLIFKFSSFCAIRIIKPIKLELFIGYCVSFFKKWST